MLALEKIEAAGFKVALIGDDIDVTPTRAALTNIQRAFIKSHKMEIISQLSGSQQQQQNIRERIEERAGIMEYDCGLTRKDAEQAATASMRVYCYKTTENPTIELTVIMPNTELDEAIEKLKNKYRERLLDVYPSPYCITYIPVNITKH